MTTTLPTTASSSSTNLPEGRRMVRFDQMAQNMTDRVDNPSEAGVERYVRLEHLDPESLKLRRWGKPDDVEATKLRFQPGDIIFGKRRFYQRKLAVADFEGICSAHALVLRAREDTVVKEFLPFFMQSKTFFERAMSISVGSLSPTINWTALARQEFPIPPKGEQRRIADILWAADNSLGKWQDAYQAAKALQMASLADTFDASRAVGDHKSAGWTLYRLDDVALVQTGLAKGKSYGAEPTVTMPYLRVANVQDGYLDLTEIKEIVVAVDEVQRYTLRPGDVLLTEGGDFDKLGRGTIWRGEIEKCLHQNHIFCVRTDATKLLPEFLTYQIGSAYGKLYFLSCAKKTTNLASINSAQVRAFPVLIAPLDLQHSIIANLEVIESSISSIADHIVAASTLKKSLLDALLTPNEA